MGPEDRTAILSPGKDLIDNLADHLCRQFNPIEAPAAGHGYPVLLMSLAYKEMAFSSMPEISR